LDKAQKKCHLLEGLIIALNNIDKAIAMIKASKTTEIATNSLMKSFALTLLQAQAILDMKLQRLTSLEQDKIRQEQKDLLKLIEEFKSILASEVKILGIIKNECQELKNKYGDKRKTQIVEMEEEEIIAEDLIESEDVVITISHAGYIKRLPIDTYKQQRRGGKGVIAATTKEEDWLEKLFIANTHSYLLFFTDKGKVYWLKVYSIPEASRQAKGKAIINLINVQNDEKITAVLPVKIFDSSHYIIMATKQGVIKKTNLESYGNPRLSGIIAITLDEGDTLIGAKITDGYRKIILASRQGKAVKFDEKEARPVGRASRGSRGINLNEGDSVIDIVIADEERTLLTITENGYGKRSEISDYREVSRGSKGVINIICSERNGNVVSVKSVFDDDDLMFISQGGQVIRTPASGISVIGRNTQGLRIMKLDTNDKVVAAERVVKEVVEEDNGEEIKEVSE
jgi:DNA gyrase subunit A